MRNTASPQALRAGRELLGLSTDRLAQCAGVAPETVVKAEAGNQVARADFALILAALRLNDVLLLRSSARFTARRGRKPTSTAAQLQLGAFVTVKKPRLDGTFRVLFEVPPRLRPPGWPPTVPLPADSSGAVHLDAATVAKIRERAKYLRSALEARRAAQAA